MKYEIMLILNPKQSDKEIEKNLGEIKTLIADHGFEIVDEDVWGPRPMAYKMKGQDIGYYVVLNFKGEPAGTQALRKDLLIQNGLLRSMTIKVPEDYVLMRHTELAAANSGAKLSKHAEELSAKVTGAKKASKKEETKTSEEDGKKLDEQLKAIIDDEDIEV